MLVVQLTRGHEDQPPNLVWLFVPWLMISLYISYYLAHSMTRYMMDDNLLFLESIKRSWIDLRYQLACIPVLGQFFTPDEDKTKNDDDR